MKIRNLLSAAGIAAMALSAGQAFAQSVELSFWSWRVEDKAFYDDIAKDYAAKTGVKVTFTPYKNTEYPTVLSAALAGGGGPDIIHARAYGALATLADAGYFLPLTKENVPNIVNFSDQLLAGAKGRTPPHNANIYGVPFATQALGIYYNKSVLKSAGIETLPKTWDEFKALCKTLKDKNIACLSNGSNDVPGLEQMFGVIGPNFYGGTAFFNDVIAGKKKFTDPAFVQAIAETAAMKDFLPRNHQGVGENEARTLFANGLAAFYMSGTWNIDTIRTLNAKADFGIMAAPPLKADGAAYVSNFADGNYAVNAKTKHAKAAADFVNYLASKEYGRRFTDTLKQSSAITGVAPSEPLLVALGEQASKNGTPFLMLVGFRYQNPNGSVMLRDGIQKIIQGGTTPEALAQEIQTGIATWHKFQ
ncbi:MAG: extracellular solute-binding protein [Proteobacteria bacterium]|nr:extracellular solute-binding protein [Pseudomonadota bacterium]